MTYVTPSVSSGALDTEDGVKCGGKGQWGWSLNEEPLSESLGFQNAVSVIHKAC